MSFQRIRLKWRDREYSIEPDRIVRAIAAVEDFITLGEIHRYLERGTAPLGKVSQAYAAMLRHAGARVTEEEVYDGIFGDGDVQVRILDAVQNLMILMIPPKHLSAEEKAGKGGATSETTGSSPKLTAPSSAPAGAAVETSGR